MVRAPVAASSIPAALQRALPIGILGLAIVGAPILIFEPQGLPRMRKLEQELASVEEETENGSLCAIEIESVDMWRPIGLVQRRGEPSAAVRAFISLLRTRDVL